MAILDSVKRYIGIEGTENDDLLLEIIGDVEKQLRIMTGLTLIPEDLSFVVKEVAIVRYNRLGSEGMETEDVDGYKVKYLKDDYSPYLSFILSFTEPVIDDGGIQEGSVTFY